MAATQQQKVTGKKSFGQTVKQSMKVLGGQDVPNYTLYYNQPTKNRRAGEHETIVYPYIEIGRASTCAVQYGDEFSTVSRKHAAIRFDEGRVMVKHLSSSNPTIIRKDDGSIVTLNVEGQEQELTNGYEVQFSKDGPSLRFNATPTNTSSIGFTQRLQLFGKQALRPYRLSLIHI